MYVHKRQREDIRINQTRILIMYTVKSREEALVTIQEMRNFAFKVSIINRLNCLIIFNTMYARPC